MVQGATAPEFQWFENIWKGLNNLYHKDLVLDKPAEWRN